MNASKKHLILTTLAFLLLCTQGGVAQNARQIQGKVFDEQTQDPVAFASIVLFSVHDSTQISGTVSDINGNFILHRATAQKAFVKVSHVKYTPKTVIIEPENHKKNREIGLSSNMNTIDEIVVAGKRKKAASSGGNTTFYINEALEKTSSTGIDIIRNLPGVHVDLMQNVSIGNKQNIILLVDGKKRDIDYLKQLNAASINKIEINQSPGASHEAEAGGVININLKKPQHGVSGNINAEIPANPSEIFLFPNAGLNYTGKNISLFASYNGEFSYFNIHANKEQELSAVTGNQTTRNVEYLNQKNWSNRLNYGINFNADSTNTFSYYGYFNPYSNEHDGDATIFTSEEKRQAQREDENLHNEYFNAFFYEKKLHKKGLINIDANHYYMSGKSDITYTSQTSNETLLQTNSEPRHGAYYIKTTYSRQFYPYWKIQAGLNSRYAEIKDLKSANFDYTKKILAYYGQVTFSMKKIETIAGLRIEHEKISITNKQNRKNAVVLPHFSLDYTLSSSQKINLVYRKSIKRPNRYELNPGPYAGGIDQIYAGNPDLISETHNFAGLNYNINHSKNYYSGKVYYRNIKNSIDRFYYIENGALIGEYNNIGTKQTFGIELRGAQNLFSFLTLYHSFDLFSTQILPKNKCKEDGVNEKTEPGLAINLSAIFSLPAKIEAKATFQYRTPEHNIQAVTYSDALYFISLQKKWENNLKLEITSGVPFRKTFTYEGHKITGKNFSSAYEGNIQLSGFPVWVKISYTFSRGKKQNAIHLPKQPVERRKKGF